jgi:hypothetical protein
MNRPSATAVRRTAADLSDQVAPHLASARDTLVNDVLPKAKDKAKDALVHDVMPRAKDARDTLRHEVLPKTKAGVNAGVVAGLAVAGPLGKRAKATGSDVALKMGAGSAPKKSHKLRTAMVVAALGAGAYAAWNAWRLPHASDDWVHADSTVGGATNIDSDTSAPLPRVTPVTNGTPSGV